MMGIEVVICVVLGGVLGWGIGQKYKPLEQVTPIPAPPTLPHGTVAVVCRTEDGELAILSEHSQGQIVEEIKTALRTPGLGVRWPAGHIEWGQE